MKLNSNQIDILDHTVHRTANGLFCGNSDDMRELVELGLMVSQGKTGFCPDEYFCITVTGQKALKEVDKIIIGTCVDGKMETSEYKAKRKRDEDNA